MTKSFLESDKPDFCLSKSVFTNKTSLKGVTKMKTLLMSLLAFSFLTAAHAKTGSESLNDAHRTFLKGNFNAMVRHIINVLQQGDEVEGRNAMKLLEKAYAQNGGSLPADFKLPKEINKMRILVRRRLNEDVRHRIAVRGSTAVKGFVQQLKVTRYPDTVVLDKDHNIGEWKEEFDQQDKVYYFDLTGPKDLAPVPEGLYFIHMRLSDGTTNDGYVILSNVNSTTSPELISPYSGETFATSTPTIKWKNFISPQYKPVERRFSSVDIWENSEVNNYKDRWSFWHEDPSQEEATVGQANGTSGDLKLADGPYSVSLNFQERRKFGDLYISRESQVTRNFYIKTK